MIDTIFSFSFHNSNPQHTAFVGLSASMNKALEESGHIATEAISAIRTVHSFNLQGQLIETFSDTLDGPLTDGFMRAVAAGLGAGYSQFVMMCSYSLAFYVGARFINEGNLSFQEMMRVFMAITMSSQAVGTAISVSADIAKADAAKRAIFHILDTKSPIDPFDSSKGNLGGEVSVDMTSSKNASGTSTEKSLGLEGRIEFSGYVT